RAYEDFCIRVERQEPTWLDPYGAEEPGEFFAVVSEAFFELPGQLAETYPDLYQTLKGFYRQDPRARLAGAGPAP
ncbi:MAG: zinc-dependent peptidase, partial [Candidatus Competibacteraceae bacterium]|nr:zinc-dependent peptidase [Candidatus Competibacteraceae bacterium]